MNTRYELLDENDLMQGGDVVVFDDGDEMEVIFGGGWDGCKVKELFGWASWESYYASDNFATVAVLRPPTN